MISLDSVVPGAFDENDTAMLMILAGLIGLAVDNVRLQCDLARYPVPSKMSD